MANVDENQPTPVASKPSPNLKDEARASQASSSHPEENGASPSPKKRLGPKELIVSVAARTASQPLQNADPDVWGVLTAISSNSRKRRQGMNMLLNSEQHLIGRMVEDVQFQIESSAVSANHCKIYRKTIAAEDAENMSASHSSVYLKDTSTNGTFLNFEKLKKTSPEVLLSHGDIISFAAAPHHELAFVYVYREVLKSSSLVDGALLKRKAEELSNGSKRLKGIGIGAPEGPISLDDFRSLQRSNMELRKQLESQVITIDSLRNENRTAAEHHENQMKKLKDLISQPYIGQIEELRYALEFKQKELLEAKKTLAAHKHSIEDLNERLLASVQSCTEANEIISSQKISISELKEQLDEERVLRREEREKAAQDLKTSIQRVQAEAQEEVRRLCEAGIRREREQHEVISKLQEEVREKCLLVESLRSKLEDTRGKLVISDNKARQLEAQLHEKQLSLASERRRVKEFVLESNQLRKELESEKSAREEAWSKVSALELEINAAMRDLDFERRRLKAARERIMLRETQLRAFYSTTEEISSLFAKQQKQLKAMQRALEDEDNYDNTSVEFDLNTTVFFDLNADPGASKGNALTREKGTLVSRSNNTIKEHAVPSTHKRGGGQAETSSEEVSATEKHDCDMRSQDGEETQEVEFTSTEQLVKGGFGSDIEGVGTAPVQEGGDPIETEQVLETESPGIDGDRNVDQDKCVGLPGDTMQLDDESHEQDAAQNPHNSHPPLEIPNSVEEDTEAAGTIRTADLEIPNSVEDTEGGGTIRTADLLASEVAGSWACSTAPSVHGENDCESRDHNVVEQGTTAALQDSNALESQNNNTISCSKAAPIQMIAPEHKAQVAAAAPGDVDKDDEESKQIVSISDTEDEGENESESRDHNMAEQGTTSALQDSNALESQKAALVQMIGIIAPECKAQFAAPERGENADIDKDESKQISDTQDCTDKDDERENADIDKDESKQISDTQDCTDKDDDDDGTNVGQAHENDDCPDDTMVDDDDGTNVGQGHENDDCPDDTMVDDDDATQEDSVG